MTLQVPASIDAEQALLGSLFLYPDTFRFTLKKIYCQKISCGRNKNLSGYVRFESGRKTTDVATVITRLQDIQELNSVEE